VDLALLGQLLVSGIVLGAKCAVMSVSFWLVFATTRTFHLAHAVAYAVGGYAAAVVCASLGMPLWVGLIAALVVSAGFGGAIEAIVYRPLRARGVASLGIFLASLGVATAGPNVIQVVFGTAVRPIAGFPNRTLFLSGITVTTLNLIATAIYLAVIATVAIVLYRTRFGHVITAVRTNTVVAMSVGIPVERAFMLVFALASAVAGLVAYFDALNFVAFPAMGLEPVLYGMIGMFLGGIGRVLGAALGGFLLGFLLVFSGLFLSANLGVILVFAILVLILIFRPDGLIPEPRLT
jgi:branched-chain amino acid transport system permease protein